MRLIDVDALIDSITINPEECPGCPEPEWIEDFVNLLDIAPVVEERKTGKWIQVHGYCTPGGDPVWKCSVCGKGEHVYGIEHGTYGADISDGQWVACPNCGSINETEW